MVITHFLFLLTDKPFCCCKKTELKSAKQMLECWEKSQTCEKIADFFFNKSDYNLKILTLNSQFWARIVNKKSELMFFSFYSGPDPPQYMPVCHCQKGIHLSQQHGLSWYRCNTFSLNYSTKIQIQLNTLHPRP